MLEKSLTLDIALLVEKILKDQGYKVLLTRKEDINLSLKDRASLAKNNNADIFVSIHFNASPNHNAQGTETFVTLLNSDASARLCLAIQNAMVKALGLRDRNAFHPGGIKRKNYDVLNPEYHASKTACVLHEISFLDTAEEEQKLRTEEYRYKIAKAISDGVKSYIEESELELTPEFDEKSIVGAILKEYPESTDPETYLRYMTHADKSEVQDEDENDTAEFSSVKIEKPINFSVLANDHTEGRRMLTEAFRGVESKDFDFYEFKMFIEKLGLHYFKAPEFLIMGSGNHPSGKCPGKNTYPPKKFWTRIANTALMLDEIRRQLNAPVRILSCYRSPSYNKWTPRTTPDIFVKVCYDWLCFCSVL